VIGSAGRDRFGPGAAGPATSARPFLIVITLSEGAVT
jgi:hypothetical protein